jgi:hypothetical protein
MKQKGQIPKNTPQQQMDKWVREISYHAIHWCPTNEKYKNYNVDEKMKIAVTIACKAIRSGTWKTPYGLAMREIVQRELEAQSWKEMEKGLKTEGNVY